MPADWGVARAHEVASEIEGRTERELDYADATAHVEPCVKGKCVRCAKHRTTPSDA